MTDNRRDDLTSGVMVAGISLEELMFGFASRLLEAAHVITAAILVSHSGSPEPQRGFPAQNAVCSGLLTRSTRSAFP
jgi:hypothetical protein